MALRSTEASLRMAVGGLACALAMASCSPASRSRPAGSLGISPRTDAAAAAGGAPGALAAPAGRAPTTGDPGPAAPPARAAAAVESPTAAAREAWTPDCRMAHDGWVEAARAARVPIAGLDECLAAGISPCDLDVAAVRSSLAELSTYDHLIRLSCGGSR